jgi:hypothetical protein
MGADDLRCRKKYKYAVPAMSLKRAKSGLCVSFTNYFHFTKWWSGRQVSGHIASHGDFGLIDITDLAFFNSFRAHLRRILE